MISGAILALTACGPSSEPADCCGPHADSASPDVGGAVDAAIADLTTAVDGVTDRDQAIPDLIAPDLLIPDDLTGGADRSIVADQSSVPDHSVTVDLATAVDQSVLDLATAVDQSAVDLSKGGPNVAFAPAQAVTTSCKAGSLLLRDFTGDGKLDLAIHDNGTVCALVGQGNGTFKKENTYPAPGTGEWLRAQNAIFDPEAIDAADFDGDKKLDLVAGIGTGFYLLAGHGDGTFSAPVAAGANVVSDGLVVAGDFNGDGKADVFGGSRFLAGTLWAGAGNGTFAAPANFLGNPGFVSCYNVSAGDFLGNGKVAPLLNGRAPGVYQFLTPGNFALVKFMVTAAPTAMTSSGDVDRDGKQDIVIAVSSAQFGMFDIMVVRDAGNMVSTLTTVAVVEGMVLADINGDGAADLMTPTAAWLSKGNGSFAPRQAWGGGLPATTPAAGDLDNDGKADVVSWTKNGLVAQLSLSQ